MTPGGGSSRSIRLRDDDPPGYLTDGHSAVLARMVSFRAVPASDEFKGHIRSIERPHRREHARAITDKMEEPARDTGCAAFVLMRPKYEVVGNEAAYW